MNGTQAQRSNDISSRARHSKSAATHPTGFFSHAHDFQIKDSNLYDLHYHEHRKAKTSETVHSLSYTTVLTVTLDLEYLQQFISEGALHDSMARYPPPKCHPMTREKVLKIIMDWINHPRPRWPIIWLNGPAGAGKSAIAQTIAVRCSDETLAASFFFLRNSFDRGSVTRLFTTLAWQLAKNIPEMLYYIESAIEAEPLLPTKSIDIQFDRLIVQPLVNLLHDKPDFHMTRFLVIIDGVDECAPDRSQQVFLRLIGNALSDRDIPLRFLICSRPEAHIQETFESHIMAKVTQPVLLDDQFEPENDIRRYLDYEFVRISSERDLSLSGWPPNGVIDKLVSKSSGQFIYASTVVKFIDDINGDPRAQLDIVLKLRPVDFSSPFAELDQLYIQILSQQRDIRLLKDLFTLIIALRQPSIAFVCRRLRISKEELELKLRGLRSLVHLSDSVIDAYHLSLHDFFRDKKRAGSYFIHPVRVTTVRLPGIMRPVLLTSALIIGIVPFAVLTLGVGPVVLMARRRRSGAPEAPSPGIP